MEKFNDIQLSILLQLETCWICVDSCFTSSGFWQIMSTTDISYNHICDIVKEIPFTWPKSLLMAYIHFISRGKMNFQKKLLGNLPFLRCDFGLPLYKYQNVCLSISNQNRSEEKECKEAFIEFLRESLFR